MRAIRQLPSDVIILIVIVLVAVGGGFLYGFGRQPASHDVTELTAAEQATDTPLHEPESGTADPTVANSAGDGATGAGRHAKPAGESGHDAEADRLDASGQIGEERYIGLCVQIVVAAIGFQNAGQGHDELAAYLPELLENEGVTMAAFEEATEVISSSPRQAERVAGEIVKRVENITGVQMDMRVLPMMNPEMAPEPPARR